MHRKWTPYGIEPAEKGWERHEFFLRDNPNGPVAVRGAVAFAATEKGELVRFEDASRGLRLTWRFLLETSLHPKSEAAATHGSQRNTSCFPW